MATVTSKDGTKIAYDQQGEGPALILVDGALGYRAMGFSPQLGQRLTPKLTVVTYDRRGRGESGDTLPYAVEREIEDIEALMDVVGGSAFLYGVSSGACLALEAAIALQGKVRKLAMYEPPYNSDVSAMPEWKRYREQLDESIAAGRSDDAVALFMALVGVPAEMMDGMRQSPMWPMMTSEAPTLAYDAAAIGKDRSVPIARSTSVTVPTLVMNGSASFPFMAVTAESLTTAIPNARHLVLEGQTHDVSPDVLAPVLAEFFGE